jgi:thioredoxin-like negative regulator of GroEL
MPEWNKLTEHYSDDTTIRFVKINSDEEPDAVTAAGIVNFPTIILEDGSKRIKYMGSRNMTAIDDFLKQVDRQPRFL